MANPGGGGNWKSNANSIIPKLVYVRAIHDAGDESVSKEASAYGKIVSLIIEKRLSTRPEVAELRRGIEDVMRLFRSDPDQPDRQAQEIRDVQEKINRSLNDVISATVAIRTAPIEIEPLILPNTLLVVRDRPDAIETPPSHQGHGLQRTLVMTLLQILVEIQSEPDRPGPEPAGEARRAVISAVEEPELYMHPQMECKMRDVLYRLAQKPSFQVICTTHSPVFLDLGEAHSRIVRVVKAADRRVSLFQVMEDIFGAVGEDNERERLRLVSEFHPGVTELFFAKRVILAEEESAIVTFERTAQLTGLFDRHPGARRDVTIIDCRGKGNIPVFQTVLNKFRIPYTVVHDEDQGNALAPRENERIRRLWQQAGADLRCNLVLISPTNLEQLLNYQAASEKPYRAIKRVEELHLDGALPEQLVQTLNWIYFGQQAEPPAENLARA
jgi:putative ATP-dependent endonuclease of the OLD family